MSTPTVTSVTTSGNIEAGQSVTHRVQDSAGNRLEANIANPSGYVNHATIRCADGKTLDASRDVKDLLREAREAAPTTVLGITVGSGGPSPLAPVCNSAKPGQTR